MGAGAVGSYYGALLARAGHQVTLVARGAHRDAIGASGAIRVREPDASVWTAPAAPIPDAAVDAVVVATKSHHTVEATREARQFVGPQTLVLSLQNGVENVDHLRSVLGPDARLLGGIAFVGLRIVTPGEVDHQAEGWVMVGDPAGGRTAAAEAFAEIVGDAWDMRVTDDIRRQQWFKLLWNIGFNAMCAVTGATAGETLATPASRVLVRQAMEEAVALAATRGVTLTSDDVDRMAGYNPRLRDYRPSTAQDIAAGKPVERDALTGFMVRAANVAGIDVPVNRVLDGLLALQEDRATGRSAALLAALD